MTNSDERGSDARSPETSQSSRRMSGRPRGRRHTILWRLILPLAVALLTGAIVILWPVFDAAGAALGAFMLAAVLILSLVPILLLRSTLRRTAATRRNEEAEVP